MGYPDCMIWYKLMDCVDYVYRGNEMVVEYNCQMNIRSLYSRNRYELDRMVTATMEFTEKTSSRMSNIFKLAHNPYQNIINLPKKVQ